MHQKRVCDLNKITSHFRLSSLSLNFSLSITLLVRLHLFTSSLAPDTAVTTLLSLHRLAFSCVGVIEPGCQSCQVEDARNLGYL